MYKKLTHTSSRNVSEDDTNNTVILRSHPHTLHTKDDPSNDACEQWLQFKEYIVVDKTKVVVK